jgi:16S rRNA processing protein RimM
MRLTVALVRGFRGLHGQVRVELLTDRPEDRFAVGARLHPEGSDAVLTVAEAVPVADGPGWWLRFREISDRTLAEERLRDRYLEIDAPTEPQEAGRWLWHELLGLAVASTSGESLGTIADIYRAGGAEVFVVRGSSGELDVPGVRGIVTELDPGRGVMVVDLDALALDARPVEDEDYVRPRDRRPRRRFPKGGRASRDGSPPAMGGGGPGSGPDPR